MKKKLLFHSHQQLSLDLFLLKHTQPHHTCAGARLARLFSSSTLFINIGMTLVIAMSVDVIVVDFYYRLRFYIFVVYSKTLDDE